MACDVLLVRPRSRAICADPPPLGLGYLATHLKRAGLKTAIVDLRKPKTKPQALEEALKEHRPKVAGIQAYSRDINEVRETLELIRATLGEACTVVAGGPHVSTFEAETFSHFPELDYAIAGEGEVSFPALVRMVLGDGSVSPQDIPGLIYRDDGDVVVNPRRYVENLDDLGFPDRELLDVKAYRAEAFGGGFSKYAPATTALATRGCPMNCAFCCVNSIMGRRIRVRSVEHVIEELAMLQDRYGFREVKFVDDFFAGSKSYILSLADAYRRRGLNLAVSFACGLHPSLINDETLTAMKSMGVYEIQVAIESGSNRILERIGKRITVELAFEKVKLIRRHGFSTVGYFLLGFPGETLDDIRATIRLSRRLPLDRAHFNTFCPFPGSPIYDELKRAGKLNGLKLEETHFENFNYSFVDGVSVKQLNRIRRRALLGFYLRPRPIASLLSGLRRWSTFTFLLSKAMEYFGLKRTV